MELKSIKEETKKEYPKMGQVKSKKLKKCIPSKWFKIGITSFVLGLMLKNTAYATESTQINGNIESSSSDIVGGMVGPSPTVEPATHLISDIICCVAIILSIASAIRIFN